MAGDLGEKEGGRRLAESLNASPADAELLTRLVPFFMASWANLLTASSMTSSMARQGPLHNRSPSSPSSPRILLTCIELKEIVLARPNENPAVCASASSLPASERAVEGTMTTVVSKDWEHKDLVTSSP